MSFSPLVAPLRREAIMHARARESSKATCLRRRLAVGHQTRLHGPTAWLSVCYRRNTWPSAVRLLPVIHELEPMFSDIARQITIGYDKW